MWCYWDFQCNQWGFSSFSDLVGPSSTCKFSELRFLVSYSSLSSCFFSRIGNRRWGIIFWGSPSATVPCLGTCPWQHWSSRLLPCSCRPGSSRSQIQFPRHWALVVFPVAGGHFGVQVGGRMGRDVRAERCRGLLGGGGEGRCWRLWASGEFAFGCGAVGPGRCRSSSF